MPLAGGYSGWDRPWCQFLVLRVFHFLTVQRAYGTILPRVDYGTI